MSLHDFFTAHASGGNATEARRIGFAIRYLPTYVRQRSGPSLTIALARGEDVYRHFEYEPRPARDLDPVTVAFRDELLEKHRDTQFAML